MKLLLPERKKLVHTARVSLRWGDMDAVGHVNNTLYFRYLEIARIEWFDSMNCIMKPGGVGPLIVNAFCNFHKQLTYPADVVVKMYASDAGKSSFETWGTIERVDEPGVLYATGGATTVWVDQGEQKAVPLPPWFVERIS